MPTTPYLDLDSIHTPSVGGTPPASWGAGVRNNLETVARPPGVALSSPSVSKSGGWASIAFTSADLRDTDGFHDPASQPEKITIPSGLDGWYLVTGLVTYASNTTGGRAVQLLINGSSRPLAFLPPTPAFPTVIPFSNVIRFSSADVIELQANHNSGGSLAISARFELTLVAWP